MEGAGDSNQNADTAEVNYKTALSQSLGEGGVAQGRAGPFQGNASPEQERVASLPVASPFHSERFKTEVELLRRRPVTLDQNAQRVGTKAENIGLGEDFLEARQREPHQDQFLEEAQVRIARLEKAEEAARRTGGSAFKRRSFGFEAQKRPGVVTAEVTTQGLTDVPVTLLAGD